MNETIIRLSLSIGLFISINISIICFTLFTIYNRKLKFNMNKEIFNYNEYNKDIDLLTKIIKDIITKYIFINYNNKEIPKNEEEELYKIISIKIFNSISDNLMKKIYMVYNEDEIIYIINTEIRLTLGYTIVEHNSNKK